MHCVEVLFLNVRFRVKMPTPSLHEYVVYLPTENRSPQVHKLELHEAILNLLEVELCRALVGEYIYLFFAHFCGDLVFSGE